MFKQLNKLDCSVVVQVQDTFSAKVRLKSCFEATISPIEKCNKISNLEYLKSVFKVSF